MKNKIRLFAILMMLSSATFTAPAFATDAVTNAQKEVRVEQIRERVEVIKGMDLSHLDKLQRKDMRHELKDMNKELRDMGPGIYISVGALIVIILLLIILL